MLLGRCCFLTRTVVSRVLTLIVLTPRACCRECVTTDGKVTPAQSWHRAPVMHVPVPPAERRKPGPSVLRERPVVYSARGQGTEGPARAVLSSVKVQIVFERYVGLAPPQ